jgi:hypothetical protein
MEVLSMKPRAEIEWFSRRMESRLASNERRGTWKATGDIFLLDHLHKNVHELAIAILSQEFDPEKIVDAAADVGNYALMLADNTTRRRSKTP